MQRESVVDSCFGIEYDADDPICAECDVRVECTTVQSYSDEELPLVDGVPVALPADESNTQVSKVSSTEAPSPIDFDETPSVVHREAMDQFTKSVGGTGKPVINPYAHGTIKRRIYDLLASTGAVGMVWSEVADVLEKEGLLETGLKPKARKTRVYVKLSMMKKDDKGVHRYDRDGKYYIERRI